MEVRAGYKQTEVGVIPGDWEVMSFGRLFAFTNGVNEDKTAYGKGVRFINVLEPISYSHIYGPEIPGRVEITGSVASAYSVRPGDIVFNRTSETDSELGMAAVYLGDELVVFGGFVIRGRPIDDTLDPLYSGYALRAKRVRSQIINMGQGAVRANIGQQNLRRVLAAVPPKPEQRAIGTALSDVDALLSGLARLIAKKRDLKQAAMQQLLTGQTRLPGFHDKWDSGPLKRFVRQFIVPMRDKPKHLTGGIPWCRIEDFEGMYLTDSKSGQGVDAETVRAMNLKVYPVGTLLVSCSADLGRCAVVGRPLVSNQTFIGLEMDAAVASNVFFFYWMSSKAEELNNLSAGTTISYLSREHFEEFGVLAPRDRREQTAIAAVLSDMDAELSVLEARRDKTRALKQAIMHELLTGRTRLVPMGGTDA